jgi:hypothetical protein
MKLYHGTSTKYLKHILKGGIKPRGRTGKSNWKDFPSMDKHVYLSSAYPLYFARAATNTDSGAESMVVFEIDVKRVKEGRLYPDEDFIAQALVNNDPDAYESLDAAQRHSIENIEGYRHHWNDSLKRMGNVSHRGRIPVSAITRYVVIDPVSRMEITMAALDPTITTLHYAIKGGFYRNLVEWIFGDREELPQVEDAERFERLFRETGSEGARRQKMAVDFWRKESMNRNGVEVFKV